MRPVLWFPCWCRLTVHWGPVWRFSLALLLELAEQSKVAISVVGRRSGCCRWQRRAFAVGRAVTVAMLLLVEGRNCC